MSEVRRNLAKINILEMEFADLAVRTKTLVGFRLEYAGDSSKTVRIIPPDNVAMRALRKYYFDAATLLPNTVYNRERYKKDSRLIRSRHDCENSSEKQSDEEARATALDVLESDQLLEPPKPIEFVPLSTGCMYVYGDKTDFRNFASISEEAGNLANLRPKTFRTWYEFLFDYGIRTGAFRWDTLFGLKFTNALNLPRLSTEAIASLYDVDHENVVANHEASGSAKQLGINALGRTEPQNILPKEPAWKRLKLRKSTDGSDHCAELDSERIRICGDAAFNMLDILQKRNGERVKGTLLHRPDKVLKLLDPRLQEIIEAPGRGRRGYAML